MAKTLDTQRRSSALLARFLPEPRPATQEAPAEEPQPNVPPSPPSPAQTAVTPQAPSAALEPAPSTTPPLPQAPPAPPSPEQLVSDVERALLRAFEPPVVLALLEPVRKAIAKSVDAPDADALRTTFETLEDILEVALFTRPSRPGVDAGIGAEDG